MRAGRPACCGGRLSRGVFLRLMVSSATVCAGVVWPSWCACCLGRPRCATGIRLGVPIIAGASEGALNSASALPGCVAESQCPKVCTGSKYDPAYVLLMDPSTMLEILNSTGELGHCRRPSLTLQTGHPPMPIVAKS